MLGAWRKAWRADSGAVAPVVGLALFALIGAGGLAFDYARLAALDTELQNAADQAALAAASQLDRSANAQTNAIAAITNATAANRLAANSTRFGNDGLGTSVEFTTTDTKGTANPADDTVTTHITFCSAFDDSVANRDDACVETTEPTLSRFVMVTTTVRTARYAFTPILAAFGGSLSATSVAGVESSICNVAPLLVCVPANRQDFPTNSDIGKGIVLKPLDGISGNYGLLDFGNGTGAVTSALMGFGLNGCQSTDDNETEPGTKTTVTDAVNTRMDVFAHNNSSVWNNSTKTSKCDLSTGAGCPSANSTKDMVLKYTVTENNVTSATPSVAAASCPATPDMSALEFEAPVTPPVKGFDRDNCFYSSTCGAGNADPLAANIGDGNWDRTTYFDLYHGGDASGAAAFAGKAANQLTRYDVYRWENQDRATRLIPRRQVTTTSELRPNGRYNHTLVSQCTYPRPITAGTSYPNQKDRRVLPIVAANCTNLKGKGAAYQDYLILRAFDIFLTEPSQNRTRGGVKVTDEKEIFGEVVGPATTVGGGSGFQYYSRSRPYLVR